MLLYMKIRELKTQDKHVRVSFSTWQKLRTAAFNRNTRMKTVFEDIISGKIKPEEL
jgi:hypothetical protein